ATSKRRKRKPARRTIARSSSADWQSVGKKRPALDPRSLASGLFGGGDGLGRQLPQAQRAVATPREGPAPVRRNLHSADLSRVPLELAEFLAGCGVPHAHRALHAAGRDAGAVGREGDGTSPFGSRFEEADDLAALHVPQARGWRHAAG